jgi:hypothetical protein
MSLCLVRELRLQACVFVGGKLTETAPFLASVLWEVELTGSRWDSKVRTLRRRFERLVQSVESYIETGYTSRIQSLRLFAVSKQTVATPRQITFLLTFNPRSSSLRHLSQIIIIIIQWASGRSLLTKASSKGSPTCKPRADRSTPISYKACVAQMFTASAAQSLAKFDGS